MQLMADVTEKMDGLMARKIQTNEEAQLNMGNTYQMMSGSYMERKTQKSYPYEG